MGNTASIQAGSLCPTWRSESRWNVIVIEVAYNSLANLTSIYGIYSLCRFMGKSLYSQIPHLLHWHLHRWSHRWYPRAIPLICLYNIFLTSWPWPLTYDLTYELDLVILPLDLHAKIQVRMSVRLAMRVVTHTQIHTQIDDVKAITPVANLGCKNIPEGSVFSVFSTVKLHSYGAKVTRKQTPWYILLDYFWKRAWL